MKIQPLFLFTVLIANLSAGDGRVSGASSEFRLSDYYGAMVGGMTAE